MSADQAGGAPPRRVATVLESVEEIRALARSRATVKEVIARPPSAGVPTAPVAAPSAPRPVAPADGEAEPFRPVRRPSMALLVVIDDGDDEGEEIRIRRDVFTIGRVEGDLVIPHDGGMSGRHAEISRRVEGAGLRWYLRDLNSMNGTFVRAANVVLREGQEILLGGLRLRFEAPAALPSMPASAGPSGTQRWQALSSADVLSYAAPTLVEQTVAGPGRRFPLPSAEIAIGRDRGRCAIVLDDPMVSPVHARITRDTRGRWTIHNASSRNGLWARVDEVPLDRGGQFQCGEQRFLIKIL